MTDMCSVFMRASSGGIPWRFFTQRGVHQYVHTDIERQANGFERGRMGQHQLAERVRFLGGSARDFRRHAS